MPFIRYMDITTAAVRSTTRVVRPFHTFEGEGFPVRRPFPQPELPWSTRS